MPRPSQPGAAAAVAKRRMLYADAERDHPLYPQFYRDAENFFTIKPPPEKLHGFAVQRLKKYLETERAKTLGHIKKTTSSSRTTPTTDASFFYAQQEEEQQPMMSMRMNLHQLQPQLLLA